MYLYVMKKEKLKALFEEKGAKQADFVAWSLSKGVIVNSSEISRHVTKGGISRWAKLAYLAFFREFTPRGYIVPDQLFNDSTMKILKESFKDFTIADMNARLKELEEKLQ